MDLTTQRIRALNDELRRNLPNSHAVITTGVAARGSEAVARIVKTVAVYDEFCHANDPYEEHDFGALEAELARKCRVSLRSIQRLELIDGVPESRSSTLLDSASNRF